jgi:hypothetical protein
MDLTQRQATAAEDLVAETRNIEIPGMADRAGEPGIATIRRLPASEVYLLQGASDREEFRAVYRRWAQAAIISPRFSFNGDSSGVVWDDLPFVTHEGLARQIAEFSFQSSAAAAALGDAFRGGHPAGGSAGGAGGGLDGAGDDAPGEPPAPAVGPEPAPTSGA